MHISTYIPKDLLSPFIKAYLIIECPNESTNRILPDTSLVMTFRYKGQVSDLSAGAGNALPSSALSGLRKSARLIRYMADTGNILVLFKEAGASAFIKEPLYQLVENSLSLDSFAGYRHISLVEEQLAGATNNVQRIALIERFLLSRLYNRQPDQLILTALQRIHLTKGIVKMKELADALYISQDAFEKRFRRTVGVSPKHFSYIARMRSIVNGGLAKPTLMQTAFDAGYFDQPHFIKDFKLFTGQTPTDFLKSPVFW
jgi:AraC-like DNA-binding protein